MARPFSSADVKRIIEEHRNSLEKIYRVPIMIHLGAFLQCLVHFYTLFHAKKRMP